MTWRAPFVDGRRMQLDPEFRRGWAPLFAATVGMMTGILSLPFYLAPPILPVMGMEVGWTFGQMTLGISILITTSVVAGPVAGYITDRYGARPLALASLVLSSVAVASLALNPGSLALYYLSWCMLGILGVGTTPITWTRTVNQWFERRKGLAIGICVVGPGLITILVRPIFPAFVEDFGWRISFLILAAAPLFVAFPIAFLAFRDPPGATTSGGTAAPDAQAGLAAALRNHRFWIIALPLFPLSLTFSGVVVSLEVILRDAGISSTTTALLVPVLGIFSTAGRIMSGWLLDKFWAPAVAFVVFMLAPVALLFIATGIGGVWGLVAAFALLGLSIGSEYGVMSYLVARYFSSHSYGAIYAIVLSVASIGGAVGPAIVGRSLDSPGSFKTMALTLAALLPIAAAAYLALGKYRTEKVLSSETSDDRN